MLTGIPTLIEVVDCRLGFCFPFETGIYISYKVVSDIVTNLGSDVSSTVLEKRIRRDSSTHVEFE
jgi:hypothetical protein